MISFCFCSCCDSVASESSFLDPSGVHYEKLEHLEFLRRENHPYAQPSDFNTGEVDDDIAKGKPSLPTVEALKPDRLCRGCGKTTRNGRSHCVHCTVSLAAEHLIDAARAGPAVAHTPEARARQAETQRQQARARLAWVTARD
jgi:hypothetical protein